MDAKFKITSASAQRITNKFETFAQVMAATVEADRAAWAAIGITPPQHIDDVEVLAARAGVSADEVLRGAYTLGQVFNILEGRHAARMAAGTEFERDTSGPLANVAKKRDGGWLARAMLMVRDHPEGSDARIATTVHVDKSTLSKSKMYQAARALARKQGAMPGQKDKDGAVEAVDGREESQEEMDARIDGESGARQRLRQR